MKSKFLILNILLVILITGCGRENVINVIESETWKSVVSQEWSSGGSGFYFHEDEGVAYCTYMIYGSGVRVARYYESAVEINDEGSIVISLPEHMSSPEFRDIENANLVEAILSIENNAIIFEDYRFEVHDGVNNYQYILDVTE